MIREQDTGYFGLTNDVQGSSTKTTPGIHHERRRRRCGSLRLAAALRYSLVFVALRMDVVRCFRCSPSPPYARYRDRVSHLRCALRPLRASAVADSVPPPFSLVVPPKEESLLPSEAVLPLNPKYRPSKVLVFILVTVGIWLSEPFLSLVDTAVVGKKSLLSLAALGPATMIFDTAVYLIYFLAISTNNLLATALAEEDEQKQANVVSNAMALAVSIGLVLMVAMWFQGETMLGWVVGKNANLVPEALIYIRIRSLSVVASIVSMVTQGTALARIDTVTPVIAVLVAMVVNVFGDYALCIWPFNFGIAGAAAATSAATIFSTAILVRRTHKEQKKLLDGTAPLLVLPSRSEFWRLCKLAGPIFFVMMGKVISYSMMTIRATGYGMTSLAAHNVLLRVFFFFATWGDALSQTAQSYLPGLVIRDEKIDEVDCASKQEEKEKYVAYQETTGKLCSSSEIPNNIDSKNRAIIDTAPGEDSPPFATNGPQYRVPTLRWFLTKLFLLGITISSIIGPLGTLATRSRGRWFTDNLSIINSMASVAHWMGASLFLHPFIMIDEGTLIAKQDLLFLVYTYIFTIGLLWFQLGKTTGIKGVWQSLFVFQCLRGAPFRFRVWMKQKAERTKQKAV
mmetsp:Transcript_20283/g.40502  ORF Transcript_20283/g.40502 Transcript_20283/m.40502 type:complete len:625 (+) Transcript_20283:2-1876(+)